MYIGTGSVVHSMSPGTGVYHRVGQTDKGIEGIPVQHVSRDRCVPQGGTDKGIEGIPVQQVSRDRCVPQGGTEKGTEGIPVQMSQGIGVSHRVGQTD